MEDLFNETYGVITDGTIEGLGILGAAAGARRIIGSKQASGSQKNSHNN
jgi:hypothetical protein